MTAFPVDGQRWWNTAPRGWMYRWLNGRLGDLQIANLIQFNCLKTRIRHRQPISGYRVATPEMVFGVCTFPHTDEKFSLVLADVTPDPEGITEICMAALIERAAQSNPWLYRNQHALPRDFLNAPIVL